MATSSSPTCGVIKMDDGEIPELADFFKKTIVTEADLKAYHDLGWLSGNLISLSLRWMSLPLRALPFSALNVS
jgi:hypothetical protein